MNTLVILESPSKAHTVKTFLGKGYKVLACKGHVRDLPKSKLGIDTEHDFAPQYINIRGKSELINDLKKEAKKSDLVLLATDPDREGEAISWHLQQVLGLDNTKARRITFNEVTKTAFKDAIKHPRDIDMNLVDSQQARRILDRLVGYKISPFLWKKIKSGLSAGRVQSVTTRLIVERDDEIRAFVPEEYWTVTVLLTTDKGETVTCKLVTLPAGKAELKTKEETDRVLAAVTDASYVVRQIKKSVKTRKPLPPFTTSTLQQDANRRLNFQSQRTMMLAQELYEGVHLGDKETHGLITYMRTDSVRVADEAAEQAKAFITDRYGAQYYPKTPNKYKTKSGAQDAHEAIRPSDPSIYPEDIKDKLTVEQYKLYKLIWERFTASQMCPAEFDTVSADIDAAGYGFRATGHTMRFNGYLAVYGDDEEDEDAGVRLPELTEGAALTKKEILPEQHFTQPPAKFTEGSLVKVMEEKGIGRPSTYTPTITTIIARGYIQRNGKVLEPTELGRITTNLMKESFPKIVDYDFTATMEADLDKVESGTLNYIALLHTFYGDFVSQLEYADQKLEKINYEKPVIQTDLICEKCGATMIVKEGRFGKFAACPNYPTCKNTKKLGKQGEAEEKVIVTDEQGNEILADTKCPKCGKDMILRKGAYGMFYACRDYPTCRSTKPYAKDTGVACPKCGKHIVTRKSRSRKTFYSCEGYPDCDFSCWDLPTAEKCPKCGGILLKNKHKKLIYCINKCGYSKEDTSGDDTGSNE